MTQKTSSLISVLNTQIAQVDDLYSLNDLHAASGGEKRHQPSTWLALEQTRDLIRYLQEFTKPGIPGTEQNQKLIKAFQGGNFQGTYVCKELTYAYAMWISPKFQISVIRTFDAVVRNQLSEAHNILTKMDDYIEHLETNVQPRLLRNHIQQPKSAFSNAEHMAFIHIENNKAYVARGSIIDYIRGRAPITKLKKWLGIKFGLSTSILTNTGLQPAIDIERLYNLLQTATAREVGPAYTFVKWAATDDYRTFKDMQLPMQRPQRETDDEHRTT